MNPRLNFVIGEYVVMIHTQSCRRICNIRVTNIRGNRVWTLDGGFNRVFSLKTGHGQKATNGDSRAFRIESL